MPDDIFAHPRLAAIYDALDAGRGDLVAYLGIVDELGARSVIDLGCGTGTFALLLASRGLTVVGIDPATASLDVARGKPGAERVRWIDGDARSIPVRTIADLVTITGNAVQAIVHPTDWAVTLDGAFRALRPGGHLVFETRNPTFRGWSEWNRAATHRSVQVPGVGRVETWTELTDVDLPLVTFRTTWVFEVDGAVLTSDSTLRFRTRDEVETDLNRYGFEIADVRDAPDRPGRELVVLARRRA